MFCMHSFSYLHNQEYCQSVSTVVSLPDSLDIIEHQPAEAETGESREAHEHVDGGVCLQAPGQQWPHCRPDGAAAVDDGGDGGDGLAGALERLVLTQLCADRSGDQGEGAGDEDTLEHITCHDMENKYSNIITEYDEKKNISSITTVANKIS